MKLILIFISLLLLCGCVIKQPIVPALAGKPFIKINKEEPVQLQPVNRLQGK